MSKEGIKIASTFELDHSFTRSHGPKERKHKEGKNGRTKETSASELRG
jgi:hypothetical protein